VSLDDFLIRAAVLKDFPAIRALIRAVQINPIGLDWHRFQVAVSPQGGLLGCGQIKPHADRSKELASIAVQESERRSGIAHKIITTLLKNERERPLYLMCRTRLNSFYQEFGFKAVEIDNMPPYFKRISRLERIFNSSSSAEDRLLVMCLD
jgi:N-acetylglutamate synthase-like GNAT family acetyltransferase